MAEFMHVDHHERTMYERLNPFDFMPDHQLIDKFRFSRVPLEEIINLVRMDLTPTTINNHAIPVNVKVALALQFLATGSFFHVESLCYGISKASVSRSVSQFIDALVIHRHTYIKMPTTQQERRQTMFNFYEIAQFPNVVGAIDGSHIPILCPKDEQHLYVCRKGYHSINIQAVCGPNKEFYDIVANWPGSTHDSFIWSNSHLSTRFNNLEFENAWLLGDSGYALKPNLLTPFTIIQNDNQLRYNSAHRRTRVLVENSFGILKSRFRCLDKSGGKLMFQPLKCCKIIIACAILHNIAIKHRLPEPMVMVDLNPHPEYIYNGQNDVNGDRTRTDLVNNAFL